MDDVFIKLELTTVLWQIGRRPGRPTAVGHSRLEPAQWLAYLGTVDGAAGDAGYCVVSVDMPGWGDSPALDSLPLGGSRAVQVVIDILNGLQKETAVLMGKSWGGGVAVKTAVTHPIASASLVLTAPALREFDQLQAITQPVLLTWAEDDPVIPFAVADKFLASVPDIEFIGYPTGGHSAAQKNAGDFAPHVIKFLDTETD